MSKERGGLRLAVAMLAMLACAPTGAPSAETAGGRPSSGATQTMLVLARTVEPPALTPLPLFSAAGPSKGLARLFNASLTYEDGAGEFHAYMAEALPELNTDSWRVFPDGTMETTFRLRPSVSWHDGASLRASDFVFGWRIVSDPELGLSGLPPHKLMEEVSAPDDRTVRIRWRQPFPDAAHLDAWSRGLILIPLPQHLLQGVREQSMDAFRNHSFWKADYVGAGPYRVERWEAGSFLEARAFDGHVTGQPKIDHLKVLFVPDANAILTYLMAGEVHVPIDNAIEFPAGVALKQHWAQGEGSVQFIPSTLRRIDIQHRPEYANPRAILDVRVRRALAHAIDKVGLNEVFYDNLGTPADTIVWPGKPYFPTIEPAITRYPYDVQRTAQLMTEAGFPKDREGVYAQPGVGQLNFELLTVPGPDFERQRTLLAASWRDAGFHIEEGLPPRGSGQDEATSTLRGMLITAGNVDISGAARFTSATISRAETRWTGENKTGWSNAEYDQAVAGLETALDPVERVRYLAQAARAMSEQLGAIFLHYSPTVVAYPSGLHGISLTDPNAALTWNIQGWDFQ